MFATVSAGRPHSCIVWAISTKKPKLDRLNINSAIDLERLKPVVRFDEQTDEHVIVIE